MVLLRSPLFQLAASFHHALEQVLRHHVHEQQHFLFQQLGVVGVREEPEACKHGDKRSEVRPYPLAQPEEELPAVPRGGYFVGRVPDRDSPTHSAPPTAALTECCVSHVGYVE